jgi:hypothetical protein
VGGWKGATRTLCHERRVPQIQAVLEARGRVEWRVEPVALTSASISALRTVILGLVMAAAPSGTGSFPPPMLCKRVRLRSVGEVCDAARHAGEVVFNAYSSPCERVEAEGVTRFWGLNAAQATRENDDSLFACGQPLAHPIPNLRDPAHTRPPAHRTKWSKRTLCRITTQRRARHTQLACTNTQPALLTRVKYTRTNEL